MQNWERIIKLLPKEWSNKECLVFILSAWLKGIKPTLKDIEKERSQ